MLLLLLPLRTLGSLRLFALLLLLLPLRPLRRQGLFALPPVVLARVALLLMLTRFLRLAPCLARLRACRRLRSRGCLHGGRGLAIVGAAAVMRIVLPGIAVHVHAAVDHRGVAHDDPRRPVVVGGRVHHAHRAPAPVDVAEEEVGRYVDRAAEPEADRDARRRARARVTRPGRPVHGPVGRPPPVAIDDERIIVGDVDHLRACGPHVDDRSFLHHADLLAAAQVARSLRAAAQLLHGIHHGRLLREEGVAQGFGPVELFVHALQDLREGHQRLHARVPVLVLRRAHGVVALQAGVGARPACRLDHLDRINGRHEDLREQRIGIERDRGEHLVELGLAEGARRRLRGRVVLRLRARAKRERRREGRDDEQGDGGFLERHGISSLCL